MAINYPGLERYAEQKGVSADHADELARAIQEREDALFDKLKEQPHRTFETGDTAAKRKGQPVFTGFLNYFPDAVKGVAEVSLAGNAQHHPGTPLHWDKSKSTDEADALARHLIDAGEHWDNRDTDGMLHAQKAAWRAMALLQRVYDRQRENSVTNNEK